MSQLTPLKIMAQRNDSWYFDSKLLVPAMALLSIGLIMVASSSFSYAEHRFDDQFYFVKRHFAYLLLSMGAIAVGFYTSPIVWSKYSLAWILLSILLLIAVLVPGVGLNLNGSRRWLGVGGFTLQVSEFVKVATVIFLAAQLEKYRDTLSDSWPQFLKLMAVVMVLSILLILEPDFGSVGVLGCTFMVMLFLGGSHIRQFLSVLVLAALSFWVMATAAPYRMARLTAYLDPWSDKFDSGYQLTQSLIAFGRGELFGVGLGQSVQKMLYLPDAHTDFVFAIYAEEFGFVGVIFLLFLYSFFVVRIMHLGKKAISRQNWYAAYVLIGFGLILSGQAFINLGVNAGLLPTKGLTLPFISYGGSSLLVCCAMLGMMLRLSHELERTKTVSGRSGYER
jgi:cell division protein FtsW